VGFRPLRWLDTCFEYSTAVLTPLRWGQTVVNKPDLTPALTDGAPFAMRTGVWAQVVITATEESI